MYEGGIGGIGSDTLLGPILLVWLPGIVITNSLPLVDCEARVERVIRVNPALRSRALDGQDQTRTLGGNVKLTHVMVFGSSSGSDVQGVLVGFGQT
jgi:hypothetical protein